MTLCSGQKVVPGLGKAAEKIGTFTDFIEEMRGRMKQEDYTIKQLLEDVLEESGYRRELEAEGEVEGQSRLENVEELVNKAVAYWEKAEEPSLDEFLEEVALVADVDQLRSERGPCDIDDPSQPQRTGV